MKTTINSDRFRRIALTVVLFTLLSPALWAGGRKQIEKVIAEGGEIWQNDFDIRGRKKGLYNYIVHAADRAGNEAVSGPFNVRVNPNAGIPAATVVYPQEGTVIRENIDILGIATGRFPVTKVMIRLDDEEWIEALGTEYWNKLWDFSDVPDGRHTFHFQAIDEKGVHGYESKVNFILDTSPPVFQILSHNIGDLVSGSVTIKGRVSDANGIQTLEYSDDGTNYRRLTGTRRGSTTLNFSVPLRTGKMEDGPVVFYLRAVDNTGVAAVFPCLFFVDNNGPEVEIYTPMAGEDVFGSFVISGRAYDTIGISKLRYEWGKIKEDIPLRPGDPFFSVPLEMVKGSSTSIRIIATDKVGNVTTVTRRLEDKRKVKVPVVVIDYPPAADMNMLAADASIFGHIETDGEPLAVLVEGFGQMEAMSSFRIGPEMLLQGRRSVKITPVGSDGTRGNALTVRFSKVETSLQGDSPITVESPEKYSWQSGQTFSLKGRVEAAGATLEYRAAPYDNWYQVYVDPYGYFDQDLGYGEVGEGPVHLELRATVSGVRYLPIYHPFNRAVNQPVVRFFSPPEDYGLIHGNKTVIGSVEHGLPITRVEYTLDREHYDEIPITSNYKKSWFDYFCDFNAIGAFRGQLVFRFTDASGQTYERVPEYVINPKPPVPIIIVNTPEDEGIVTAPFGISGMAYDQVGINGVYWRFLGPDMDSISPGAAGWEARGVAEAFQENPNVPFTFFETDQSFNIPIDFSIVTDGEYILEVYASDIYGVRSEVTSRMVKVSTKAPETRIMYPVITRYNSGAILMRGFSSDANGISHVTLSMDNGNTWQDVVMHENDDWELALNTAIFKDGIYSALIRTEDKYGIVTFSTAMVNIDNTPPELYITTPQNGQHVGSNLYLAGRASDNIQMKSLVFQIISAENPDYQRTFEIPPELVIFETMSLAGFPQGEYIIRIVAKDLADNETIVSRKIVYDADDTAAQIAIFNPLPGEFHTGPINVVGIVTGSFLPENVMIMMDSVPLGLAGVDRYGVFHYIIPEGMLDREVPYKIYAYYNAETGVPINSPVHTVYYDPYGPVLMVNSHNDGDVITKRPWLSGLAYMEAPVLGNIRQATRQQRIDMSIQQVEISYDNGRTFRKAKTSGSEWKYRLETSLLPSGPQPVVVRATFGSGDEAVRRILLVVDTTDPYVETIAPPENSQHRDNLLVFGAADDNFGLANVDISLRPFSKFWYSVPGPLQGLYFDLKGFGATYFDAGLGLSLFDDNVRFQGQWGIAPGDVQATDLAEGGRYTGQVIGLKLIANIFYLPFDYLFGPDWAFYSMNFAVGANFSWFTMDDTISRNMVGIGGKPLQREALFMGALIGQFDIANINMQYFYPNWKYFRRFAIYVQPEFWFASSDVQAETIFKVSYGIRLNWF